MWRGQSPLLSGHWPGTMHPPTRSYPLILGHHDVTTPPSTSALSTEANLMCLASSGQRAWIPQLFLTGRQPLNLSLPAYLSCPLKTPGSTNAYGKVGSDCEGGW